MSGMSMTYSIEWFSDVEGAGPGFYVTFDEDITDESDWSGPFETVEAANDHVTNIIKGAAVEALKDIFK